MDLYDYENRLLQIAQLSSVRKLHCSTNKVRQQLAIVGLPPRLEVFESHGYRMHAVPANLPLMHSCNLSDDDAHRSLQSGGCVELERGCPSSV